MSDQTLSAEVLAAMQCIRQQGADKGLVVVVAEQQLYLFEGEQVLETYPVSTSRYGVGSQEGSHQTPPGLHRVQEKIGGDCPAGAVFRGRQFTGELATVETQAVVTGQDCITSRILWLSGLEAGLNQGEGVDSYQRYIYIHGTHEEGLIGQPASIGCVRMRNADVIRLYNEIDEGTLVYIAG